LADIALDLDPNSPTYRDVKMSGGDLQIVDGKEAILQNILQRLRIYLGEWFMDNTKGIDYFNQILVKNPQQSKIDAIIINQILSVPGVTLLTNYSFSTNFVTRVLLINFKCQTTSGIVQYSGQL